MDVSSDLLVMGDPWASDDNTHKKCYQRVCKKRELLECVDIGATTYIKCRVELDKVEAGLTDKYRLPTQIYACASVCMIEHLLDRRFHPDCFMSMRVTEDNGYVMNSALVPTNQAKNDGPHIFGKDIYRKKHLKGKYHLEVLFVDALRIGDEELCQKYATNINARLTEFSDTTCLKEKVKKAEKWLGMARKKKAVTTIEKSVARLTKPTKTGFFTARLNRFPLEGNSEHVIMERWIHDISKDENPKPISTLDESTCSAIVTEIFKKSLAPFLTRNTHSMFEFFTEDASRIVTKLRPHNQNGPEMIADTLRRHGIEKMPAKFLFAIYAVDIPAFAPAKRAESLLHFVRENLGDIPLLLDYMAVYMSAGNIPIEQSHKLTVEMIDETFDKLAATTLVEECTELFEKKCNCEKLHLSSYCHLDNLDTKSIDGIQWHSWNVTLSDLTTALYINKIVQASDIYLRIASLICRSSFSGQFGTGTNILCELLIDGKWYSSKPMHHTDVEQKRLRNEMFQQEKVKNMAVSTKFRVFVYVVDILAFATNEQAHHRLNYVRLNSTGRDVSSVPCETENGKNSDLDTISTTSSIKSESREPVVHNKKVEGLYLTLVDVEKNSRILNSDYFKKESTLAVNASTEPLKLNNGYRIISSKTPINTSKGRIMVFLIEMDSQFHSDVLDNSRLLADIFIDIVKNTEISVWSGRRMKITLKWYQGGFPVSVILSSEDLVNPENLTEVIFGRGLQSVMDLQKQFYLEVQYRVM